MTSNLVFRLWRLAPLFAAMLLPPSRAHADDWDTAIHTGMKQEKGTRSLAEIDAEKERQKKLERFRWRLGATLQTSLDSVYAISSASATVSTSTSSIHIPFTVHSFSDLREFGAGGGLQVGLSRRWEVVADARLLLGRQSSSGTGNFSSSTSLGFSLEPLFQLHPGGLESPIFIALGANFSTVYFSLKGTETNWMSGTSGLTKMEMSFESSVVLHHVGPQVGGGFTLGDDEQYELSLRLARLSSLNQPGDHLRLGLQFSMKF